MQDHYLKVKQELNNLYPEYIKLSSTKENQLRLQELIDIISGLEYKLLGYIKSRKASKNHKRFRPY